MGPRSRSRRLFLLLAGAVAVIVAMAAGVALGPSPVPGWGALAEVVDRIPGVAIDSGLTPRQAAIVWELRFPRVVLGLLVGSMLATAGGAYQGVFRNPLADPYLLGVAAGAGLGATLMIVQHGDSVNTSGLVPVAAFAGAMGAVLLTYLVGASGERRRSPASLLLAGVAVSALLTAIQTFIQQRRIENIREVYSWLLGRLSTAGWSDVWLLTPYVLVSSAVILLHGRVLDVMSVGDDEAQALGMNVRRARLVVVTAASLGTAAAVAVGGLIGFVGIIVPHTARLLGGISYRTLLPVSLLFGGGFLVVADLLARTVMAPVEVPIGVITAFFGAPFFIALLRGRSLGTSA